MKREPARFLMVLLVLALCLAVAGISHAQAQTPQIKISQVYGGAQSTSPSYGYDYIELFNNDPSATIPLDGWYLLVHQDGSNPWTVVAFKSGLAMPPKTYLLIRCKVGNSGGDLPGVDWALDTIDVPLGGVIAIFSSNPGTVTGCVTSYVDKIGYNNTGCAETQAFVAALDATHAAARKVADGSEIDTNNNSTDFELITPNPHFSGSQPLPVQLVNVEATSVAGGSVRVNWATASEIDNYGFYVERKGASDPSFVQLAGSFQAGHGTSLNAYSYSFTDGTAIAGVAYQYRIKQVDLNGTVHYSEPVAVTNGTTAVGTPGGIAKEFTLKQNYPNPFNPSTMIEFTVKQNGMASLRVFNALGQEVATLFSGNAEAGNLYAFRFDAARFSTGIYFARLESGQDVRMMKMTLLK